MTDGAEYATVVIGFGNALRRDDGAGPAVIDRMRRLPMSSHIVLVDTHQLTPELADLAGRSVRLILIDAGIDHAPGTIHLRRVAAFARRSLTHRIEAEEFVRLARQLHGGPKCALAYTIGVESLEFGEGLSSSVSDAVSRLASRLGRRLSQRIRR